MACSTAARFSKSGLAWCVDPIPSAGGDYTEGQAIAEAHAGYLRDNPGIRVVLEGHTDERGTREYNLALGENRARTVADVLMAMGVDVSRIENVSYGEENPVAEGHDESAWRLNRRVEIRYGN